ncbi:hypothetical protein LOTGIDRAFT_186269, partial [Lottia gigantea]
MESKCSKVLIPCDTSDHMEYGVQYYYERFHKQGNEVVFLHVDNETIHEHHHDETDKEHHGHEKIIELMKDRLKKMSVKAGNLESEFLVEKNKDVGHTILKVSDKIKADCIVMVSKDRGKIRRTLMGTVCDTVAHSAHLPVVLI